MNAKTTLAALGLALLLSACGNGQDDDNPALQPQAGAGDLPAGALATTSAYAQFAASLVKSETDRPLDLRGMSPPTSETASPITIL